VLTSGDQVRAVVLIERRADALGLPGDSANMIPARSALGQPASGVLLGPGGQHVGFHIGTLSAGAGLGKSDQALHQLGGLAVLGLLEVRVGGQGHVAIGVSGPARHGPPVHTAGHELGDHEVAQVMQSAVQPEPAGQPKEPVRDAVGVDWR
jgi:hypothetical protein